MSMAAMIVASMTAQRRIEESFTPDYQAKLFPHIDMQLNPGPKRFRARTIAQKARESRELNRRNNG